MATTILDIPTVPASGPEDYKAELEKCKGLLKEMITKTSSAPIMVRLAWHDSGTYAEGSGEWPACGGANGSIRFVPEIKHGANNGLVLALELLKPIKQECPKVTYADLFQLASAVGIEVAGGPKIPMKYGRAETDTPEQCPKEGNLPAAEPPFPGEAPGPAKHLRDVFHRMGLTDKDIVALSGAHTLGRAHQSRSGVSCGKEATKYTSDGPGTKGGSSWTAQWLKFDNSYFTSVKEKTDAELLVLPTDACLFEDASFKEWAEKYAADQEAFFADYCESHKKLSELGSKFLFEVSV